MMARKEIEDIDEAEEDGLEEMDDEELMDEEVEEDDIGKDSTTALKKIKKNLVDLVQSLEELIEELS